MYRGATGAGASVKVSEASAPIVIKFYKAVTDQKICEPIYSRLPAYVSPRVTVPSIFDEPLHTHLTFFSTTILYHVSPKSRE